MSARECSIDGCEKPCIARGWCRTHYQRWYKHGSPLLGAAPSTLERLEKHTDRDGPVAEYAPHLGPCWLWTAFTHHGYGRIQVDGESRSAHRVAYELLVGPIPDGLCLDHLCRVRNCVNPAHLEPVTNGENVMRGLTITAMHAAKTHCPRGHAYDEANTYMTAQGWRNCRACRRENQRRYTERRSSTQAGRLPEDLSAIQESSA